MSENIKVCLNWHKLHGIVTSPTLSPLLSRRKIKGWGKGCEFNICKHVRHLLWFHSSQPGAQLENSLCDLLSDGRCYKALPFALTFLLIHQIWLSWLSWKVRTLCLAKKEINWQHGGVKTKKSVCESNKIAKVLSSISHSSWTEKYIFKWSC